RSNQDHAFIRFKSIHLHKQRIQSLLALIVPAAQSSSAMASNRIDFIDENNARRILLALFKKIANAACAHAHEHLNEVRTRNREERDIRFAGNCSRQQSLASSRRPNQQHALGNSSAQLLKLLRILQEIN